MASIRKTLFPFAALLLLAAAPGITQTMTAAGGGFDLMLHMNTDANSAPSPLVGTLVGRVRFSLLDWLVVEPGLGLYYTDYFFRGGRALPAEIEYKDATTVLGLLLEIPALFFWKLADNITLEGGFSPTLSLRIPFMPHGNDPGADVAGYFFGSGRFLFLEAQGGAELAMDKNLALTARLRALIPIFHLWDGEGLPFNDQMAVGLGVGVRYYFR